MFQPLKLPPFALLLLTSMNFTDMLFRMLLATRAGCSGAHSTICLITCSDSCKLLTTSSVTAEQASAESTNVRPQMVITKIGHVSSKHLNITVMSLVDTILRLPRNLVCAEVRPNISMWYGGKKWSDFPARSYKGNNTPRAKSFSIHTRLLIRAWVLLTVMRLLVSYLL